MITNGQDYLGKPPHKTTVCIAGTGPAGVTLAWYLLKQGIDVTLLEGSRLFGRDPNTPFDSRINPAYAWNENLLLYNGETAGLMQDNEAGFLVLPNANAQWPAYERERIYGGTSTHWGAQSRPLDDITFKRRPGPGQSADDPNPMFPGWPITRGELDPYYNEASTFCGLYGPYYDPDTGAAGYNFSAEFWAKELNQEVAQIDGFFVAMYQFFQDRQFQAKQVNGQTIGDSDAQVIVNASLLEMASENGKISTLTVGVLDDDRNNPSHQGNFQVEADVVVLACGAVANARLMLLSDVGNPDRVGHYFMGHPIAKGSNAVSTSDDYLTPGQKALLSYQSVFRPGSQIYMTAGLLTPDDQATESLQSGRCWFGPTGSGNFYHELLPEYDSTISLSTDPNGKDIFGQAQTRVNWVLNPKAEQNYTDLTNLFKTSVEAMPGSSPVHINAWQNVKDRMVFNGHHIGTTRMADSEADGVVDANLKVFGLDNLYVTGSSIWPSCGISNPTFSIIMFSIRLAEELGQVLGGSEQSTGGSKPG